MLTAFQQWLIWAVPRRTLSPHCREIRRIAGITLDPDAEGWQSAGVVPSTRGRGRFAHKAVRRRRA